MADAITNAVNLLREQNERYHTEHVTVGNLLRDDVQDGNKLLSDLLKEMRISKGDKEEERRESKRKGTTGAGAGSTSALDGGSIFKGIAAIGAGVLGFVSGLASGFAGILNGVRKTAFGALSKGLDKVFKGKSFKNLLSPIDDAIKSVNSKLTTKTTNFKKGLDAKVGKMFTKLNAPFAALDDIFKKRGTGQFLKGDTYKTLGKTTGYFRSFSDTVSKMEKSGKSLILSVNAAQKSISGLTFGEGFRKVVEKIKPIVEKIKAPFEKLGTYLKGIQSSASSLGKFFGTVFSAFKTVGRFIALPLTIITSIIEGFKGLNKGIEEQEGLVNEVLGGAIGAVMGVLSNLIAMPLDLLKSGISWIAGKLGFENFEKMLDGFSFEALFETIRVNLTQGIIGLIDRVGEVFTNLWSSLSKPFEEGFSFGAVLEFVTTIPLKIGAAFYDLVKSGVASLLDVFGQQDLSEKLDSFSFQDTVGQIVDWIIALPKKLIEGVMDIFNSEDPIGTVFSKLANLGEYIMEGLKGMIRGVLPDPDSIVGSFVPEAIYDWVGEAPPPKTEPAAQGEIDRGDEETGIPENLNDLERKQLRVSKMFVKALEDKLERTGELSGEEAASLERNLERMDRLQRKQDEYREYRKAEYEKRKKLEGAPSSQQQMGDDVSKMSAENAAAANTPAPVVVAPTSNNSQTQVTQNAAIVDPNVSTRDNNDRSWGSWVFG